MNLGISIREQFNKLHDSSFSDKNPEIQIETDDIGLSQLLQSIFTVYSASITEGYCLTTSNTIDLNSTSSNLRFTPQNPLWEFTQPSMVTVSSFWLKTISIPSSSNWPSYNKEKTKHLKNAQTHFIKWLKDLQTNWSLDKTGGVLRNPNKQQN